MQRFRPRIYTKSVSFKRQRPTVEIYFVTTGQWTDDAYLTSLIAQKKKRLEDTRLFGSVVFRPWGAAEVQAAYQRSKNNVTVEFNFTSRVTLPDIQGVSEAHLGVLPASEYLSLVTDDAGNIRKPLFYDNVRDFQGENAVNREIKATLDDPTGQQRFVILNNGVTLVARDLKTTGNKFAVSDYQIVNGCQTSHVVFNERQELGSDTYIPIKVIATTDEEIISSIITATNRQTEVTADDLFAMSGFQKKLEALYESYPGKKKLYYERRSKQYASVDGIEKVRIIDKKQQVRSFAAMFLDDPHRAARYYSDLRNQVGSKIFNEAHQLEPYYVSAYAYYKLEFLFRNNQIPPYYKPARYHLLMVFRYLVASGDMPQFTANRMQKYANDLAEALWSDTKSSEIFKQAVEIIDKALGEQKLTRDLVKTQSFTDAVKTAVRNV
jgi:AIPR protein